MTAITEEELGEIYAFAIQLGKDAGKRLMDGAHARMGDDGTAELHFELKENAADIVTQTDKGKSYELVVSVP
jgi:myo-inositol-1(or 4)-monophosphatase